MPKLTIKSEELHTNVCVMKDKKVMCRCENIADARLIKMAVEEWWRVNKKQGELKV